MIPALVAGAAGAARLIAANPKIASTVGSIAMSIVGSKLGDTIERMMRGGFDREKEAANLKAGREEQIFKIRSQTGASYQEAAQQVDASIEDHLAQLESSSNETSGLGSTIGGLAGGVAGAMGTSAAGRGLGKLADRFGPPPTVKPLTRLGNAGTTPPREPIAPFNDSMVAPKARLGNDGVAPPREPIAPWQPPTGTQTPWMPEGQQTSIAGMGRSSPMPTRPPNAAGMREFTQVPGDVNFQLLPQSGLLGNTINPREQMIRERLMEMVRAMGDRG